MSFYTKDWLSSGSIVWGVVLVFQAVQSVVGICQGMEFLETREFTTQKLKPFQRRTLEHCETDDIRQTFHGCRQTFHGCPPYKGKATCQELSRPIPMRIRGSTNAMRSCRLNQVIVIKLPSGYLT